MTLLLGFTNKVRAKLSLCLLKHHNTRMCEGMEVLFHYLFYLWISWRWDITFTPRLQILLIFVYLIIFKSEARNDAWFAEPVWRRWEENLLGPSGSKSGHDIFPSTAGLHSTGTTDLLHFVHKHTLLLVLTKSEDSVESKNYMPIPSPRHVSPKVLVRCWNVQ